MAQSKFEMKIRHTKLELDQHIEIMQLQGDRDQWKVKYDELKAEHDQLEESAIRCNQNLQDRIDELKAENEALKQQVATLHEKKKRGAEVHRKLFLAHMALQQQHQQLKAQARKLADALKWAIYHTRECQKKHGEWAGNLIEAGEKALSEYNQSKGGEV